MSPGANVQRVEILRELNQSLTEYSQTLSDHIKSVKSEINLTLDWLTDRERHWQNEVQRCLQDLQRAERAYAVCMAQPADDRGRRPSCGREAAEVRDAKKKVEKAQAELVNTRMWRNSIESKISAYIGQATRLQRTANSTISKASSFLSEKARELGDYRSIQPPSGIDVIGKRGSEYERAKQQMLIHALDDPNVGRSIKGWIRNEMRRIESGQSNRIRMPGISHNDYDLHRNTPELDAGHRIHDVHHWSNLRFEDVWLNRTRPGRARRLGLDDRIR